jgi:hypothetical protein
MPTEHDLHGCKVICVDGSNDGLGLPAQLFALHTHTDRFDVLLQQRYDRSEWRVERGERVGGEVKKHGNCRPRNRSNRLTNLGIGHLSPAQYVQNTLPHILNGELQFKSWLQCANHARQNSSEGKRTEFQPAVMLSNKQ